MTSQWAKLPKKQSEGVRFGIHWDALKDLKSSYCKQVVEELT